MGIDVTVKGILLPSNHVLMPGIVMRMGTSAAISSQAGFTPLPEKENAELRTIVPFLGTTDIVVAVIPRSADGSKAHDVGVLARVIRSEPAPVTVTSDPVSPSVSPITVQGLVRIRVSEFNGDTVKGEIVGDKPDAARYTAELVDELKASVGSLLLPGSEVATTAVRRFVSFAEGVSSTSTLVDILVSVLPLGHSDKLRLLDEFDGNTRARKLIAAIEDKVAELKKRSDSKPRSPPQNEPPSNVIVRRTAPRSGSSFLSPPRNQAIRGRNNDEDDDGIDKIEATLRAASLPADGRKVVDRELRRIKRMTPQQAEYNVTRNYLETLADLPWDNGKVTELDRSIVTTAGKILNEDHYGLDKVKRRLIEYLAVLYLQQEDAKSADVSTIVEIKNKEEQPVESKAGIEAEKAKLGRAPILLLVGPPGVGKTSLAKSVARAIDRKLHRISLGGVRDEAEIRGHRRTYIGAMPGVLVQGLRKAGAMNPVFVLDEIDKVGQGNHSVHGDPSAALLEVLDPEQNSTFVDHYIGFPVDLSNVLFIATANSTDTIPGPLLDRMEVIHIEGYTYIEKQHIAQNYLIPKQIRANALKVGDISVPDNVINYIATHYTRESGVRSLERELGTLCRGRAVELLNQQKDGASSSDKHITIQIEDLPKYLGIEKFHDDVINDEVDEYLSSDGVTRHRESYGLVNGLAYMGSGSGGILVFEAREIPNGTGKLQLTGKLGSVISESAQIAMSWVRVHASKLGISSEELKSVDIHLHAPAGAIPKDGPSAGVAMTLCLVSLLAKRPIPRDIAMTGEITLRGKILPVGGIREKLLGAHMAGVRKVLLPYHTRALVEDQKSLLGEIGLEIVYVKYIWDVFSQVWPEVAQFKEPSIDASL